MAFSPNSYKTEKICFLASFFSPLEIWRGAGFLYFQALGANSIPACTELNMDEDWATRFWFFFPFMPITEQREWAMGNYCLSPQPWKSHFLSSQPKYRRNSQARKMWGNETEKNTDWQQCFQNKSGAPCLFQIIQEFKERFGLHFSKQVGSFIFLLPRLLTPNKKNLEKFHAKCRVFPGTEYTSYLDVDSGPSTSASDGQQPLSSGPLSAREERSWDHACQRWNGGREGRDWEATREMRLTSCRALGEWCPLGMLWFFLTERKHRLMEGRRALQVAYLAWSWLWGLRALGLGSNYPILRSLVSSRVKRRHKPVLKHPVLVISQEPISRWWCDEHVFHSNADLCPLHRWENWGYICNEDPPKDTSPLGCGLKSGSSPLSLLHRSSSLHSSHLCQAQSHLLSSCAPRGPDDTGLCPSDSRGRGARMLWQWSLSTFSFFPYSWSFLEWFFFESKAVGKSEMNQRQILYDITYVWNLKNMTN